jgi:uncharacterized membrane protein
LTSEKVNVTKRRLAEFGKKENIMGNLIVITFDNDEEAGRVLKTLKSVESGGYLDLDDSAVVVRDEEGKVHVHNEMDRGVKIGAVGGGLLGLLIAGIFAPIAAIIVGAVAGGLIGASFDLGISKKFIKDVQESLQPGTSAIFFVVRDADPDMAIAALRPYKGTVYQTSLPPEAEESLRRTLSKRS